MKQKEGAVIWKEYNYFYILDINNFIINKKEMIQIVKSLKEEVQERNKMKEQKRKEAEKLAYKQVKNILRCIEKLEEKKENIL